MKCLSRDVKLYPTNAYVAQILACMVSISLQVSVQDLIYAVLELMSIKFKYMAVLKLPFLAGRRTRHFDAKTRSNLPQNTKIPL